MKMKNLVVLALAMGIIEPAVSNARDMFQISWRGTIHYYDSSGRAISRGFSERDVIQKIAQDNGLDPRDLVLVYRPDAYDTAVVSKSTGQAIDYFQMPDVSKPSWRTDITGGGQTVRQAFLFDENSSPIGSIVGTERQRVDANGNLVAESFHGTFQFAIPDDGNHIWAPGVYSGTFATGRRIVDATGN